MNKTLRKALTEKCKDMGLTQLAIDRLVELGGEGLADDASEEDITAKVDWLVPFAKAMQSEVTRKTSSTRGQSAKEQSTANKGGEGAGKGEGKGEDENKGEDQVPAWAQQMQKDLADLRKENAGLKAERAKADRASQIAAKAKELGIPDYLMKRVSFADDADFEKELAEYKQELVNNNLVPMGQAHELGSTSDQMKADALAWAKTLPDK